MFSDGPARVGTDYSFYGYGTVRTVFSTSFRPVFGLLFVQ